MAISQSDTQWIKKGQKLSDGTVATRGYLASKTNDKKKITGAVAISTATKRAAAGTTSFYTAGRAGVAAKPTAARRTGVMVNPKASRSVSQTRTVPRAGETKVTPLRSPNAADRQSSQRVGTGLRGTPSARGKLGTGSGSTTRVGVAPKPKRPMTAAERNKATGGVNAYGMMGGSEGTVRTQRNKSKTGVFTPEFTKNTSPAERAAAQAKADAAAKSRRSTEERLRTGANKILADRRTREAAARKAAEEQKKSSGPKIGETKRVSAGVGYVQMQKYTSKGWVNVGPKRRSK